MSDYKNKLYSLSPQSSSSIAKIYGVGIAGLVLKQQAEGFGKDALSNVLYSKIRTQSSDYEPDAQQNSYGGYDATPFWDGHMSSSLIGMPVMCPIKFIGNTYIDLEGNSQTIQDVTFETVLINVQQSKIIEKSDVAGRNSGSIKEHIGMRDYSIEIRVIISADAPVNENIQRKNQSGVYPRDNMREIIKMLEAPISIPVQCWFLEQFKIRYLVIEDGVRIEQTEGQYTNQVLVIPCISDNPLIISIAN